jgi:NTE family protein
MSGTTRALILSGGGTAGGAWMLGLLHGLREEGVDLGDADLIVGTSAGARAGTQLAAGIVDQGVSMYRQSRVPEVELFASLVDFGTAALSVQPETPDRHELSRQIANFGPLGAALADGDARRRMVAAHLPADGWPRRRLEITAVDAQSGARVTFNADSGVALLDAVTASGALPGIFPLVSINGTRYCDGGVHSPYNADLAAGHDVVVVLTPMVPVMNLRAVLNAEIAALGDATVRVVTADAASLAAIGPNPLSGTSAKAALNAGVIQAAREYSALREIWTRPLSLAGSLVRFVRFIRQARRPGR